MSAGVSASSPAPLLDTRALLAHLRDAMAAETPAQQKLDDMVQLIARTSGAEVCSLYLQRAGEVLELFATVGLKASAVHNTRLRVGEGLVGTVAATRQPLATDNAPKQPQFAYRPETGEEPFLSFCAVPLIRAGKVRGVLAIQHRAALHYSSETIEALQTVAMVLAELVASGEFVDKQEASTDAGVAFLPARLTGVRLNPGLAVGRAVLRKPEVLPENLVSDNPGHEVRRLQTALSAMHASLDILFAPSGNATRDEVLSAYRLIAADRGWIARLNEAIRTGLSAEGAVLRVLEQIKAKLNAQNDDYLRERITDFEDLSRRLLQHLLRPADAFRAAPMPQDAVLVARNLGPAELLEVPSEHLRAIVLEEGAATSHVVIVARALGLPVIGQCAQALTRIESGDELLIDADNAVILVRPSEDVRAVFLKACEQQREQTRRNESVRALPSVTADGTPISLLLNCGLLLDVAQVGPTRADGIGLYRTEIPFLARDSFPDVAAQTEIYKKVLASAGGKPVTFRTLDIGGDKFLPYLKHPQEENPALGWRAIRIGLDRPAWLRTQLRALLRAAAGQNLKIMFPMVTDVAEFRAARKLLQIEQQRALARGEPLPARLEVGAMLEVPALLFQLPALLEEVDFLSVGSNDLLQFVFAADRGNRAITNRYDPLCPAVLTLLGQIARTAKAAGKPLTLCGELASHPLEAMVLIGLGFRNLSLSAGSIDAVKLMLRALHLGNFAAYLESLQGGASHSLRPQILAYARDHGVISA
jgi:phosphotransferase system, enzyme I, PtsP